MRIGVRCGDGGWDEQWWRCMHEEVGETCYLARLAARTQVEWLAKAGGAMVTMTSNHPTL